ncbi:uncharacterized protein LOC123558398 [Mercenaria mercenaria]|uniref:uncharacterized protein LOC123558398 n=1 Tax=Mercenaria mercenaria TaxID=6596 RepID=UPI00234E8E31|nr:uncharacterized protein LOC123558398 [Mercenaria mercenaria]
MLETIYVYMILLDMILFGFCFRSDQMHERCGSVIDGKSGEIVFDANKLPEHVSFCKITLSSGSCLGCSNNATRLMFYFAKFNMSNDCKNINVSLLDGYDNYSPSIEGLPDTLCGHSRKLLMEECVFSSTRNKMSVYFTRSGEMMNNSATFSFVYSSFHTGVCDKNLEFECSQDSMRHIGTACFSDEEFCKGFNDTICFSKPEKGKSSKAVKYILCGLLGIVALFGLKFIYHQYMKGERGGENCISRMKRRLARTLHEETSTRLPTFMTNLSECSFCSDPSIVDGASNVANLSQINMDILDAASVASLRLSPSAPTLEEIERETPTLEDIEIGVPGPPPPTYDESIVPSYNEVMTHQDKYIVH